MPTLTRFFIKTALVYLLLSFLLALAVALPDSLPLPAFVRYLNPTYFHLFVVGWITQMIFGVIFWMFPIISRAQPRGNEALGWATYGLLNVGLLLRLVGEPLLPVAPDGPAGMLLSLSAVLQWLAAFLFLMIAWPRVRDRYRGE